MVLDLQDIWCDALRGEEDTWNKLMTSDPPESKSALHLPQKEPSTAFD
jgi:hypothetical protein